MWLSMDETPTARGPGGLGHCAHDGGWAGMQSKGSARVMGGPGHGRTEDRVKHIVSVGRGALRIGNETSMGHLVSGQCPPRPHALPRSGHAGLLPLPEGSLGPWGLLVCRTEVGGISTFQEQTPTCDSRRGG